MRVAGLEEKLNNRCFWVRHPFLTRIAMHPFTYSIGATVLSVVAYGLVHGLPSAWGYLSGFFQDGVPEIRLSRFEYDIRHVDSVRLDIGADGLEGTSDDTITLTCRDEGKLSIFTVREDMGNFDQLLELESGDHVLMRIRPSHDGEPYKVVTVAPINVH